VVAERNPERGEEEPQKTITVCNAKVVWKNPGEFPDTDFIFVSAGEVEFTTQVELKKIAGWIVRGSSLPESIYYAEGQELEMNYKAPRGADLFCVDGYFGRPLVPHEVYAYYDFTPEQIEELEAHLAELREERP
jgi:hypothetical protein